MSLDVTELAQRMKQAEAEVRAQITAPVLVLVGDELPDGRLDFITHPLQADSPAGQGRPLAWLLRKDTTRPNPFPMGITVGRVVGNDVVLAHPSVSRLHAYFVVGKRGEWRLFDAESMNGTWVEDRRLPPNIPSAPTAGELLGDKASLRIGHLVLQFFRPASFLEYLRSLGKEGIF